MKTLLVALLGITLLTTGCATPEQPKSTTCGTYVGQLFDENFPNVLPQDSGFWEEMITQKRTETENLAIEMLNKARSAFGEAQFYFSRDNTVAAARYIANFFEEIDQKKLWETVQRAKEYGPKLAKMVDKLNDLKNEIDNPKQQNWKPLLPKPVTHNQ